MQRDTRFSLAQEYAAQGLPLPVDVHAAMTAEGIIHSDFPGDPYTYEGNSISTYYTMEPIFGEEPKYQDEDPGWLGGLPGD